MKKQIEAHKTCPVCGLAIKGRQDKKFCSPKCKNTRHYEVRLDKEAFFFEVERHLKTNRKILKQYNRDGYTTLRKEKLLEAGFNPRFITHYWKNHKGQVYLFCYEYGFQEIDQHGKKKYLLVKWQDYMYSGLGGTHHNGK